MKIPTATLLFALGTISCGPSPQMSSRDNLQLLHLARFIADNVRVSDPDAVGKALHTTFTGKLSKEENILCQKQSTPLRTSFTQFSTDPDFWFVSRPDGVVIKYMTGPDIFNPNTKVEEHTLGAPQLDYFLIRTKTCAGVGPAPAHADVPMRGVITRTQLSFSNIPGYTCVTADQVMSVFASLNTPRWTDVVPPLQYIGRRNTIDFYEGAGDFQEGQNGPVHHQPACLITLSFEPHIPKSELRGE